VAAAALFSRARNFADDGSMMLKDSLDEQPGIGPWI
jgi:hypothetical protein